MSDPERCCSAPVIKWVEVKPSEFVPDRSLVSTPVETAQLNPPESSKAAGPHRLRRHSSLSRGVLQRVRTNSEQDERAGEAKVKFLTVKICYDKKMVTPIKLKISKIYLRLRVRSNTNSSN